MENSIFDTMLSYLPLAIGMIIGVIILISLIKLYRTNTANEAFVRTGLGSEKVVTGGGAIVLPSPLHKITRVNLNSIQLPIKLGGENALTTYEYLKVDLEAVFNLRVEKKEEAIKKNAETLGEMTFHFQEIKEFLEAKLIGALRNTVAQMNIDDLQQNRSKLIEEFKKSVQSDLEANGFELETITFNRLTQTSVEYFQSNNVFDEKGRTLITQVSETKRKERFAIEQDTKVQMSEKDLQTSQQVLEIERQKAEKIAKQEREIAEFQAEQIRQSEEARIASEKAIQMAEKQKEIILKEQEIANEKTAKQREIEKEKALQIAEQDKQIQIQNKSKEESLAKAEADLARAEAIKQEQNVITVEKVAEAERQSQIEVIDAKKVAEKEAVKIKVAAQTEKEAAEDKAKAILIEAQAKADAKKVEAEAQALQIKISTEAEANQIIELAKANKEKYEVEAKGRQLLIEASNAMNEAQVKLKQLETIIEKLPEIIHESAKPMEKIDSIKIVGGFGNGGLGATNTLTQNEEVKEKGLVDQVFDGALKYRVNNGLVGEVLKQVGIDSTSLEGLQKPLLENLK